MAPISLILAVLLVSCNIEKRNAQELPVCRAGQFFDIINNYCDFFPNSCPWNGQRDNVHGCHCPPGQLYNSRSTQCQNFNRLELTHTCLTGEYYDMFSFKCLDLPDDCPSGSSRDDQRGCSCLNGQWYNGGAQQCQFLNQQQTPTKTCPPSQYYDAIDNACYRVPDICPVGSTRDSTVGCRCLSGQVYNSRSRQCQNNNNYNYNNNNNNYNSQFYNNFNSNNPLLRDTTGCLTGQFYDRINNNCYDIPQVCPAGSTVDSTVGCTCPFGQLWNHVRGQCVPTVGK